MSYRERCPGCGGRRVLFPAAGGRCCLDCRDGERQLTLISTYHLTTAEQLTGEEKRRAAIAAANARPRGGGTA